jgi:hypothetical protein
MTAEDTTELESRRARLVARRRRRSRRFGVAAVAIIVIGAGVAVALSVTDSTKAQSDLEASATTTTEGESPLARASTDTPPRPLSHTSPLKLWVGGDSLAGAIGIALGDQTGSTGVVSTLVDYKVSSGLWNNDFRNWPQWATDEMASESPEAVVFVVGANDTPVVNRVDGDDDGVPDWETSYREKVALMMDTFVGGDAKRTVLWVGAPTMGASNLDDGAVEVNRVMREEAEKRSPHVVYVDAYKLLSGPDGGYSRTIVDENGETITARIGDGVHFTSAGAAYMSRALFAVLDARFHISQQADPDNPIEWEIAEGSGENIPGGNNSNTGQHRRTPSTEDVGATTPVTETPTTVVTETPTTVVTETTIATPTTPAPTTPPTSPTPTSTG